MKKFLLSIFLIFTFTSYSNISFGNDMLSEFFEYSITNENILELDGDEGIGTFTSLTILLLKMTGILGISMTIVAGIMYILSIGDEGKMQKAKTMIFYIMGGIVLASSSYIIVQIMISVSKTLPS